MTNKVLTVFTFKSIETCLQVGGTQSWRLNPETVRQCQYVVLCRNSRHESVEGKEPHRSAFLIGRISGIGPSTESEGRWLVKFDEYAEISILEAYKGGRNAIHYTTLEELGIDLAELEFRTYSSADYPPGKDSDISTVPAAKGMTVAEARAGLAVTFGVRPEAIEILIHA